MSKDISDIIQNLRETKDEMASLFLSERNREEEFMYFGEKDVIHNSDQINETYCETNFPPPYLYPTESLCLRTWRFNSLPDDLTFESEGCKVKQRLFKDEGIEDLELNETHFAHTYFLPTDTGYLAVKSGGVEAKVSWQKREDGSFILKDFSGRMLEVYPSYVKEVRTPQEEHDYYAHRESCRLAVEAMRRRCEEKD